MRGAILLLGFIMTGLGGFLIMKRVDSLLEKISAANREFEGVREEKGEKEEEVP